MTNEDKHKSLSKSHPPQPAPAKSLTKLNKVSVTNATSKEDLTSLMRMQSIIDVLLNNQSKLSDGATLYYEETEHSSKWALQMKTCKCSEETQKHSSILGAFVDGTRAMVKGDSDAAFNSADQATDQTLSVVENLLRAIRETLKLGKDTVKFIKGRRATRTKSRASRGKGTGGTDSLQNSDGSDTSEGSEAYESSEGSEVSESSQESDASEVSNATNDSSSSDSSEASKDSDSNQEKTNKE